MDGSRITYAFDGFRLDTVSHELRRDGVAVALEPKAFDALAKLLAHAGALRSRDELLDAVWGHRHVAPGVLNRSIAQLRRALGDDADHPRYIQTAHALGYRFIGRRRRHFGPPGAITARAACSLCPTGTGSNRRRPVP